jgi:SOS-response transcriptional repressor LexA
MFAMARSKAGIAIQSRISERDLTQGKLARALKKSQTWVSQSLLDDTEKTLRRLWVRDPELFHALLKELDWDNDKLIQETGLNFGAPYPTPNIFSDQVSLETPDIRLNKQYIPVYDPAGAGAGWDDGDIVDYIDIPANAPGKNAGYVVRGDSMSPTIPDGSRVVVRLQDYASPRNIIVAWTPDDGMLCKYLEQITDDGFFVLTSINPNYRPIWTQHINIYGIVWEYRASLPVINGNHS